MHKMKKNEELVGLDDARIRDTWHDCQWYFSVIDVVRVLTARTTPNDYWYRLRKLDSESRGIELSTFCRQLAQLNERAQFNGRNYN